MKNLIFFVSLSFIQIKRNLITNRTTKRFIFRIKHVLNILLIFFFCYSLWSLASLGTKFIKIGEKITTYTYKELEFITTLDNGCEILHFSNNQFRCMYVTDVSFKRTFWMRFKIYYIFHGECYTKNETDIIYLGHSTVLFQSCDKSFIWHFKCRRTYAAHVLYTQSHCQTRFVLHL